MDRAQTIAGEQISRRIREEERHDGEIRGQATALGQKWLSREGDNDAYAGRSSWTNFAILRRGYFTFWQLRMLQGPGGNLVSRVQLTHDHQHTGGQGLLICRILSVIFYPHNQNTFQEPKRFLEKCRHSILATVTLLPLRKPWFGTYLSF